jgi:hypothetical protein
LPDLQARARDLSPAGAEVTEAGDVVVVYESGALALWTPATMAVRPLRAGAGLTTDRPCQTRPVLIGIHERIAVVFSCGRVMAYDVDSGAVRVELTAEHPGAIALNRAEGTLYWLTEVGELHHCSLTEDVPEAPSVPLAERVTRLAFSPHGDLLFCSRPWFGPGKGGTDLYIYKFDRGPVGAPVRIHDLKGLDPGEIGIHADATRFATLKQTYRVSLKESITFWNLQPSPRQVKAVALPKAVIAVGAPVRYLADGSTLLVPGRFPVSVDAQTGAIRCVVSERIRSITRPNTHGLVAGVGYSGWEIGELPHVVLWDATSCQIRGTLNPEDRAPASLHL